MLTDQDLLHVLSLSKDATAVYSSADLHIRFINDAMLKIWGKDKGVVGKTFEEAIPEIKGQPFTDMLKKVWNTGETITTTNTPATLIIDGKAKTSYFDFEYRALFNDAGETYAILHTATDVTARVQALNQVLEKQRREEQLIAELSSSSEQMNAVNKDLLAANMELQTSNENISRLNIRLQQSETDFKRLVEQAPVAVLVFKGADMVIDLANQAMLKIINKDSSILGKPLLKGLPEIQGAPAADLLFEVYNTGKSVDGIEAPVPIMRDGQLEMRYFNFSYRPLKDNDQITGVMDIAVEVTEQVLARKSLEAIIAEKTVLEQGLRESQQQLQRILDTMAEGVVITDLAHITYANAMAQRIMDLPEERIKARSYNDGQWTNVRLDGKPLPSAEHPIYVAMRSGQAVYDQEIGIRRPGRDIMYISINAAPLVDDAGNVNGGVATFTDVTSRRMILQQKDDFISVASHELKTPVTALKASLQLLERMNKNIKPEQFERLVGQANRSLNKLSELINSLLNSNRISEGRFPIYKTKFLIADLINGCCDHVRSAGTHDIIFKGDSTLQLSADEQLIDQVIVNLVNNAVKYAPRSREIIIDAQKQDKLVKISVSDQGPGIPPDKIEHLFERYYQAEGGGRQFSGLGLGLYISAEIIRKHGGAIGVESEVGKGSTFWFTLPVEG